MSIRSSGRRSSARRLTLDAALLAAALMLSIFESLLPLGAWLPLPGFKLGLANLVTVLAFSLLTPVDALVISLLRIGITGVLFGTWTALFFSVSGATLAFLALLLSRVLLRQCSYIGISVFSAAAHNTVQTLAAAVLFGPMVPFSYLPLLLPAAVLSGTLTGVLLNLSVPRLERSFQKWNNA